MKQRRRGLSMVEVLVALSITAVLMLAVFQALVASLNGLRVNQAQAMLNIRGRTVLLRILDHIRATALHAPQDPIKKAAFIASSAPVDDTGIVLSEVQPDGSDIIYTYFLDTTNPANNQLKMTRAPGTGSTIATTTSVLLNGVTGFNIRMWSGQSDAGAILMKAAVTLNAQEQNKGQTTGYHITGTNVVPDTIALSGSIVPRQNAWSGQELSYSINQILAPGH